MAAKNKKKDASITKKPSRKVSSLATPSRDSYKFRTSWKVPSKAVDKKEKDRFEGLIVKWYRYNEDKSITRTYTKTEKTGKYKKKKKKVKDKKTGKMVKKTVKVPVTKKKKVTETKVAEVRVNKALERDVKHNEKATSDSVSLTKKNYYPYTSKFVGGIDVAVAGYNKKNVSKNKKTKKNEISGEHYQWSKKLDLEPPSAPSIDDMTLDLETGHLTATVTMYESEKNPCCGMRCWIDRTEAITSEGDKKYSPKKRTWPTSWAATKNDKFPMITSTTTMEIDIVDWQTFPTSGDHDGYILIEFFAQAFGMAGKSGIASDYHIFAYPMRPKIRELETKATMTNISGEATMTVFFDTDDEEKRNKAGEKSDHRPTDSVTLQLLKEQDPSVTALDAGLSLDWQDVKSDDGECLGLSIGVADAISSKGKYTWARIRAYNDNLYLDSAPLRLDELYRSAPTATDDKVGIEKIIPGADGTSLEMILGRDDKTSQDDDDATGIEVSWSENENAWISNQAPNTFNVTWLTPDLPEHQKWKKQSRFILQGLSEGLQYYVRARAYMEDAEGNISYGDYTDASEETESQIKIAPVSSPSSISVSVDPYLAQGDDLPVSWMFTSPAQQTSWEISKPMENPSPIGVTGATGATGSTGSTNAETKKGNVIMSNSDSAGATVIPWDTVANYITEVEIDGVTVQKLFFVVSMTTGGDPITSDVCEVVITQPPVATITVPSTLYSQPMFYDVGISKPNVDILTRIQARGIVVEYPDKTIDQSPGDVIWANTISTVSGAVGATGSTGPIGGTGNSSSTYHVEVPVLEDIYDGAKYDVYVTLRDQDTGLYSDEVSGEFTVAWSHQAKPADERSSAIGYSNSVERGCTIYPIAPEDYNPDLDKAEIYRITPDGATLIAKNVPFGAAVTDRYAPFSLYVPLRYGIGTRTADGDFEYMEVQYNVTSSTMRFDWHDPKGGALFVELPWNNKMSDSFTKDFELRQHMNGDRMGVWNDGYGKTATLSSDIIKIAEPDKAELVRKMAEHSGPVFVRTPDGCAYEADVQVSGLDWNYDSLVLAVSISATRISPSEEFSCTISDIVVPTGATGVTVAG